MKKFILSVIRIILHLCYGIILKNSEHLKKHAKTLIIANHGSLLDGLFVGLVLPFEATFVVNTQIAQHPLYKHILKLVNHIAVSPSSPLAMKQIIKLVESGIPVVIFPEGRISVTSKLMKIYEGSAIIAARTQATVVSLHITGANQTRFGYVNEWFKRGKSPVITITALPPSTIQVDAELSAKLRRKQAGLHLTQLMQENTVLARPNQTIPEAFLDAMDRFGPDRLMLEDVRLYDTPSVGAMSYKDILTSTLAIHELLGTFTHEGEYLGVLMPNASPTISVILGLLWGKRIPCMLNYTAGPTGIASACKAAKIQTILTSKNFIAKGNLQPLIDGLPSHLKVVYAEDLRQGLTINIKIKVAFNRMFPRQSLPTIKNASDHAVVLFTSGSEGNPKGVVHTHDSILANVAQVDAVADFTPNDKFLVALPLFHSFGFTAGAILPLVKGHSAFFYPSPLHYRNIPEVVYDRQCTTIFGTSTFLGNYARFAHNYDFAHVRTVVAGAEKLNPKVRQIWQDKFGVRILEGYGVTECAPVIAVNTRMIYHPGSVGALVPCMEMKLEAVPGIDDGGRLFVKGPNVMAGYFKVEHPGVLERPEHNGVPGWYDTGDIIALEENCIVIKGRAKRFAKIAGEMVSLEVSEKIVSTASPTHTHAVVSIPSANKGEALVLFTTDSAVTISTLIQTARTLGINELSIPKQINILAKIPLLGTGKTDYVSLNKMAQPNQ